MRVVVCGQNDVPVQAGEEVLLQYKRGYFADTEVCRCRACAAKKSKVDDGKVRRSTPMKLTNTDNDQADAFCRQGGLAVVTGLYLL
jgi:hypothetical protein